MTAHAVKFQAAEKDMKQVMADVTHGEEKAQRGVAGVTGKTSEHSELIAQERRSSARQPVDHPVWIDVGDGSPMFPAIMWDVSEGGAKLVISSQAQVPDKFSIILASDHTIRRECKVAWRLGGEVGVTLTSSSK